MALPAPADILAGLVTAMNTAADALMRHQAQANKVRTKATRTTLPTDIVPLTHLAREGGGIGRVDCQTFSSGSPVHYHIWRWRSSHCKTTQFLTD